MSSPKIVKRVLAALLVASAACGLLFGLHYYIAKRLILDSELPEPWRGWSIAALALLGLSLVLQPLAERFVSRSIARVVAWAASHRVGFAG
jgi:hypothetical protein